MTNRNPESLKKILLTFQNLLFGHVPAQAVTEAELGAVTGQAVTALGDVLHSAVRNCTPG